MKKKQRNLKKMVAAYYEKYGWKVADAETRQGPITRDLFGVADLVIYDPGGPRVRLVQVTSTSNASSRRKKCLEWLATSGWNKVDRAFWLVLVDDDDELHMEQL